MATRLRTVKGRIFGYLVALSTLALLSAALRAQSLAGGTIGGVVRDESGGVLPGVTVEAASPALIEKVRTVVTDEQGVYKIVDLRAGTYAVTFTLAGFSTLRREGIELTTGFTATVNADMKVGTLEETITVSGAAPIVDTQSVSQQTVFARELAEALPTNRTVNQFITLIPGAVYGTGGATAQDVGGNKGENVQGFMIHGSRVNDFQQQREGMFFGTLVAAGNRMTSVNQVGVEETVVQAGGTSEAESGGAIVNIIPRDGGNTFRGNLVVDFSHKDLEGDNLDDALRGRGLSTAFSIRKRYDAGGGLGGPIKQDRLWFFATWRKFAQSEYAPGNYYNATQDTLFYTPDLSRPAYTLNYGRDMSVRLTWRASAKDKFAGFITNERNCNCFSINAGLTSPEGITNAFYWPNWKGQASWNRPQTSRLLFEAGVTVVDGVWNQRHGAADPEALDIKTGGPYTARSVLDSGRNYRYGAPISWNQTDFGQINERFAVSYVTGSHAFKTGIQFRSGGRYNRQTIGASGDNVTYTFSGRTPLSVTYYAGPLGDRSVQNALGLYAQDQWSKRRLTLNLGLRYDHLNGYVPGHQLAAGAFVPARSFEDVTNSPDWRDLNPRVGAAFDLFGTGRTAVKAFLNRYVNFEPITGITTATSPANLIATSATRNWSDTNGDYVPQETELGPLAPTTFGQVVRNTNYADDVLHGFGNRGYSWQTSAQIQHELRPGLGFSVGYFRTWYGNFQVTDNQLVAPGDFSEYCITAPSNAALPGGGGDRICGLYDVSLAKFGQTQNIVTQSSPYGKQSDVFSGVDLTMTARFGEGGVLQGGVSTGSQATDNCYTNGDPSLTPQGASTTSISPRTSAFCHVSPPWSAGTQVKFSVVYPLPWQLQMAGTYQNNPPIPTTSSLVATNAQILPSLGRNLASCGTRVPCNGTATIELITPGSFYQEPRIQQVDIRFSRNFRFRTVRAQPQFDIYNLFNANPVLAMTTRYGLAWRNATTVLSPRVFKLGAKVDF